MQRQAFAPARGAASATLRNLAALSKIAARVMNARDLQGNEAFPDLQRPLRDAAGPEPAQRQAPFQKAPGRSDRETIVGALRRHEIGE
ncbi:hypothetical protein, partial [Mesorhizobium sp.]|uniref:hypothetical protein n=1 Tax=Mesorhizobium sp. TaxID=1871066 RepID=UPI0025D5B597